MPLDIGDKDKDIALWTRDVIRMRSVVHSAARRVMVWLYVVVVSLILAFAIFWVRYAEISREFFSNREGILLLFVFFYLAVLIGVWGIIIHRRTLKSIHRKISEIDHSNS